MRLCARRSIWCLFAVNALTLGPLLGQGRPLELEDYYRLKDVGSPALSPDGSRVAFVVTSILEEENGRHTEIWLVHADGSSTATRLTSPAFSASAPRWSPDGALLSFTSRRPGPDGQTQGTTWFLRMDQPAGEAFQMPALSGTPTFSRDGSAIAFTEPTPPPAGPEPRYASEFEARTAERFDGRIYDWMNYRFDRRGYLADPRDPQATPPSELYVLAPDGESARQLTELGVDVQSPVWSPDGSRLAFIADAHQRDEHTYGRSDVWTVTMTGQVSRLTDDEYDYASIEWLPTGDQLVARAAESLDVIIREERGKGAPSDLFVLDASTGAHVRNLTADWDLIAGSPTVGADGSHVYFSAGIGGNTHLFRVSVAGGDVEQMTTGDRRLAGFSYSSDFSKMTYRVTDPTNPGDIWIADSNGTEEVRLTSVNEAVLAELVLATPERLLFNSADGTDIEGWMLPARGYSSASSGYPMILQMHGGPHGAYGNSFSFDQQLLAARGYMVLFTNPRASTGYGEDFRWGTWGGWGVIDFDDVMSGVDHAIANYAIDEARMGATGYSYGGYLTNWVITHTDRFAAAIAGAGISNWVSDYGTADIPRTKESEFYGPPWEERGLEHLLRSSPIIHAKGVSTPTMFINGEFDHRVPIEEAEQMYVALRKQKVPAKFVRYPESYHGGWTPWRTVHRMWIQLEWWEQYLAQQATSEEG